MELADEDVEFTHSLYDQPSELKFDDEPCIRSGKKEQDSVQEVSEQKHFDACISSAEIYRGSNNREDTTLKKVPI